ncbi:MAG: helix-hairpin-helix domain-containing protein [Acidimicrobiia bacterium]
MNLEDTMASATKTVTDTATTATDMAKEYGTTAVTSVTESTTVATDKATEYGTAAATALGEAVQTFFESGKELASQLVVSIKDQFGETKVAERAEATVETVKDFQLGDKKVGERASETVHSVSDRVENVSDKIDVEQLQDQVAKLRHQMEGVVGNWKDSFRPSDAPEAPKTKKAAAKKSDLTKVTGIGPVTAKKLNAAGITTFRALATAEVDTVSEVAGTSTASAAKWIKAARTMG